MEDDRLNSAKTSEEMCIWQVLAYKHFKDLIPSVKDKEFQDT